MKPRAVLSTLALIFAMLACNLPSRAPVTETPTAEISITPSVTLAPPTETVTPLPSDTPPPTLTSTPTIPVVFPREVAVNCRLGPGVGWIVLSALNVGTSSQILGRSGDGGWWYVVDPFNSARKCWVASGVTNTAGNLAAIPIAEAPNAQVTKVTVGVDPTTISVAGCTGPVLPVKISGTIETNGPASVTWRFETQQGGALTTQTTQFDAFGSSNFSVNYTPILAAGTYWVRLVVTSPNDMQAEAKYTITCP